MNKYSHERMIRKVLFIFYAAVVIHAQTTETTMSDDTVSTSSTSNTTNLKNLTDVSTTTDETIILTTVKPLKKPENNIENPTVNISANTKRTSQITHPINQILPNTTGQRTKTDEICECDMTMNSCDINCCCDVDCRHLNITNIFSCNKEKPKILNSRYCDNDYFEEYNRSQYFIERLGNNLFCIVHENLPHGYQSIDEAIISNRTLLLDAIRSNKQSRFTWNMNIPHIPHYFNSEEPYKYRDAIWKIQNNFPKKFGLPRAGFTGICSFKKVVKYLEDWNDSCTLINLENSTSHLFPEFFNNFSVVASPVLYNSSQFTSNNSICPKNICLSINSYYCLEDWNFCQNKTTPNGTCNNGNCYNIVKGVHYKITHNGTKGIERVDAYFSMGNASRKFHQDFRIEYRWANVDQTRVFHSSGNPGYNTGKPLIIGNLITNESGSTESDYIRINGTNHFLGLPIGGQDRRCNGQYHIKLQEDLKLTCNVIVETSNFSSNTCMSLQKKIMKLFLYDIIPDGSIGEQERSYISKWGYVNPNNTDDWTKIFFDKIPENVITASSSGDEIVCSGLIDSMRLDVMYSRLPQSKDHPNYKVLAAGITFSDASDYYWTKCGAAKCTDILSVDIISYVTFHDVSKPSTYHLADGLNLDITLPHDFFYPFVSNAQIILRPAFILVCVCLIGMIF